MKRTHLLALLLLPALAGAEGDGEIAYSRACSRCHQDRAPAQGTAKSAGAAKAPGPQLDALLKSRSPEQLRAWVQAPHKVRPETRCDTRMLASQEVDSLLSFLATRAQPPPPPRDEQLRQQLQQELAERRAKKQRQAGDAARRQP